MSVQIAMQIAMHHVRFWQWRDLRRQSLPRSNLALAHRVHNCNTQCRQQARARHVVTGSLGAGKAWHRKELDFDFEIGSQSVVRNARVGVLLLLK